MAATMTRALVRPFRIAHRFQLLIRREVLASRLVSLGTLIERTDEDRETDRLVAAYRDREHTDELAELHRLRDALANELHQVRQELRK
jgi:hypothetical protein